MLAIVGDKPEPETVEEPQPRAPPRIEQRGEADAVRLEAIAYLEAAAGREASEIHRAFDVAVAAIERVDTVALGQRRLAACTMAEAEPEKTKRNNKYKGTQYFSANVLQEVTERDVTLKQQKADEEKAEKKALKEAKRGGEKKEREEKDAVEQAAKAEKKRVREAERAAAAAAKQAEKEAKAAENAAVRPASAKPTAVKRKKGETPAKVASKPNKRPRTSKPAADSYARQYARPRGVRA